MLGKSVHLHIGFIESAKAFSKQFVDLGAILDGSDLVSFHVVKCEPDYKARFGDCDVYAILPGELERVLELIEERYLGGPRSGDQDGEDGDDGDDGGGEEESGGMGDDDDRGFMDQ